MNKKLIPVLLTGWVFVVYEYAVRVSDSVILPQLSAHLGLDPAALGWLSSAYYFSYVIFMIPAGIMIDRYGLYRVWLVAISLLMLGCGLFAMAPNLGLLILARVLMGIGSNFAVIGTFALVMGSKRKGLLVGITMAFCMLGAFLGQGPWIWLTQTLGSWQLVYWLAGAFGALLLCGWALMHSKVSQLNIQCGIHGIASTLKQLFTSPVFLLAAVYVGCLSSPQTAFSALWAPTFLEKAYQLPAQSAAFLTSLIAIGGLFGGLALGLIGDHYKRTIPLLSGCGVIAALTMGIILRGQLPYPALVFCLFALGFITNASVVVFAFMGARFADSPRATVQASTNMFNMGGGPILQILVGSLIVGAGSSAAGSLAQIPVHSITHALYLMPLLILISSALILLVQFKQKPLARDSASRA
ncbi:MFS transporter [Dongshaea marina]|uniref:MFS transporter n=1 Tax=Dongshaea marina TaxID=2047966 RepID=UPI000D3E62EE|nr:MFS transporter [Dongshaea marina]